MNEQLANQIRQCRNLPTLPSVAMQVLELVQDPEADIPKLARVVSKDPALASRILKTVNSSLYARPQKISKLTQALTLLGLQTVRVLVLGFSLARNVKSTRQKGFNPLNYWRRSIYSATAALTLAQRAHLEFQEEAFIAALLMDIGMLALDEVFGEQYGRIHEKARSHGDLLRYEQAAFDTNHAEVAGVLAEEWQLPPLLAVPMTFHHNPQDVDDPTLRSLAEACFVAGRCADVFVDEAAGGAIAQIRGFCSEQYAMSEADCDQFLDQVCRRTGEIAPLFDVTVNTGISYESILRRANERVVHFALEQQQELASEWDRLRAQQNTDPLTGLACRVRLEQVLATEFASARACGAPLSLLVLDIDQFKQVNEQLGHAAADAMLQSVARLLQTAARPRDLAARMGDDELALLMPATARGEAMTTADALCRELAARPVESLPTNLTVSIGVASMEPASLFKEPEHLCKAADAALLAAKRSGRNCVRGFALTRPVPTEPAAA